MQANISEAYLYGEIPCVEINAELAENMIALAGQFGAPADYISHRLSQYETVHFCKRFNTLTAFQFLQQFPANDNLHIYYGPVFSVHGAFVQMFQNHIYTTAEKCFGQDIYLLAEIQNPKMLMMLHGLFADFGYTFFSKNIPEEIINIVPLFKDHFQHIGHYNHTNFTTRSNSAVYKKNPDYKTVVDWISAHKISLADGDNMLYAVKLPGDETEREKIFVQLHKGANDVNNWTIFKQEFLENVIKAQL